LRARTAYQTAKERAYARHLSLDHYCTILLYKAGVHTAGVGSWSTKHKQYKVVVQQQWIW